MEASANKQFVSSSYCQEVTELLKNHAGNDRSDIFLPVQRHEFAKAEEMSAYFTCWHVVIIKETHGSFMETILKPVRLQHWQWMKMECWQKTRSILLNAEAKFCLKLWTCPNLAILYFNANSSQKAHFSKEIQHFFILCSKLQQYLNTSHAKNRVHLEAEA